MKATLTSIRLWWYYQIWLGIKTIEIRKTNPSKLGLTNYFYVTKTSFKDLKKIPLEHREICKQWLGKVVAKFTLNTVGIWEMEYREKDYCLKNIKQVFIDEDGIQYSRQLCSNETKKYDDTPVPKTCLTIKEIGKYLGEGINRCFAWNIDDLVILDKLMELCEFKTVKHTKNSKSLCKSSFLNNIKTPDKREIKTMSCAPQSWCYVEVENDK